LNEYVTKIYAKTGHGLRPSDDGTIGGKVTFADHSHQFEEQELQRSNTSGIALPDPRFLRIHCAIGGILHMSGAGELLDRVLDNSPRPTTGVHFTGEDFARVGLVHEVREVITGMAAMTVR
jgi:hypothetical protein